MRTMMMAALAAGCLAIAGPAAAAKDKVEPLKLTPEQMAGAGLTHVKREGYTGFVLMRPANGAFAVVGALAGLAASRTYWAENEMVDPTNAVSERLARDLAAHYGLTVAPGVPVAEKTSFKDIGAQAGGARYVLNVQSRAMSVIYLPTKWSQYSLQYISLAQLVDAQTGKAVAGGTCTATKTPVEKAPTYEAMSADKAALLKQMLAEAAAECEARFRANVFKLPATVPAPEPAPVVQAPAPEAETSAPPEPAPANPPQPAS